MVHSFIQFGADLGAPVELSRHIVCKFRSFFCSGLVLQRGPRIHGDGPKLYFHFHPPLFVSQEYRHGDDKMRTSVSIWFRVCYIIFLFNKRYIILAQQSIGYTINILRK